MSFSYKFEIFLLVIFQNLCYNPKNTRAGRGEPVKDEKFQELGGISMDRFRKVYTQGKLTDLTEIWVDTQTGVNYVFHRSGNASGFAPLLDENGKPVVTKEL